jgi:hypothetical protein
MSEALIKNVEEWVQEQANIRIVELFVLESNRVGGMESEELNLANEAAISLLVKAGYQPTDKDATGKMVEDEVQTLLMIALLRCPKLVDLLLAGSNTNKWGSSDVPF